MEAENSTSDTAPSSPTSPTSPLPPAETTDAENAATVTTDNPNNAQSDALNLEDSPTSGSPAPSVPRTPEPVDPRKLHPEAYLQTLEDLESFSFATSPPQNRPGEKWMLALYPPSPDAPSAESLTGRDAFLRACMALHLHFPTTAVAHKLTLSHVALPLQGLADRGAQALAAALLVNTRMVHLDLRDNGITAVGMQHLCQALAANPQSQLMVLDVSQNPMGHAAVPHLVDLLRGTQGNSPLPLRELRLRGCKIGDRAAESLFSALTDSNSILALDVSDNCFGTVTAPHIARLISSNIVLRSLDISWNELRDAGCETVFHALRANGALQGVQLAWNGCGDTAAAVLGDVLAKSDSLMVLDVGHNRIGEAGAARLAAGLSAGGAAALKVLMVNDNPLGDGGCAMLLETAAQHPMLEEIDMERCGGGSRAERALLELQKRHHQSKLARVKFAVERVWLKPAVDPSQMDVMNASAEGVQS
jgi:Ran GTPase-activating protein (RanGAP) involved in mRNA processing and transport